MYYLEGENTPVIPNIVFSNTLPIYKEGDPIFLVVDALKMEKEPNELFQTKPFLISGLAVKFAKLKNDQDILQFANEHGFLGSKYVRPDLRKFDYYYLQNFEYEEKVKIVEFVDDWHWHIKHVQKLIKLYKTLKEDLDIEDIVYVDKRGELYPPSWLIEFQKAHNDSKPNFLTALPTLPPLKEERIEPNTEKYQYFWVDDKTPTLMPYTASNQDFDSTEDLKLTAMIILKQHLLVFLRKGIFIDFNHIKVDKNLPMGFGFVDRKATTHLLAAIYYDLWRMINNLEPVELCKSCGLPFVPRRKDAIYCGKTCQKRKERRIKKQSRRD
jgi:hypothetical protein